LNREFGEEVSELAEVLLEEALSELRRWCGEGERVYVVHEAATFAGSATDP
jgi:hypothetical protein